MRVIHFYPKYSPMGPSSRYRIYSYLPFYRKANLEFSIAPLLGDWYLKRKWGHKSTMAIVPMIIISYLRRILSVLLINKNSLAYIGADSLPGFPPLVEWILVSRKIPYVIEFDDAVFHNYDRNWLLKNKYKYVISHASHIITGCQYLSDYVKQWNSKITEIPTSIDFNNYSKTSIKDKKDSIPIIGWIGSTLSSGYLLPLIPTLKKLYQLKKFKLNLIGFDSNLKQHLSGLNYEIIKWSSETEIEEMEKFTVGIMPLNDSPFERGKCAFKLVQYMAIGIPTVSTPLQSNININQGCGNLFATTPEEWFYALLDILNNSNKYTQVGEKNKEIALSKYTFQNNWKIYFSILSSLI